MQASQPSLNTLGHSSPALAGGSAQRLTHSTRPPPGDRVSAGAGRAAAGAQGSLGPAPGALQGQLGAAEAAAGARPGRGLAGFPGGPASGPQLWGEPRPCPLTGCTAQQLPPRAAPTAPFLSGHPGRVAEGGGKALGGPRSWASCWLVSPQCSVSEVELLLRRHQDLEKLLAAQEETFAQLQRKAEVSKAGVQEPQETGPKGGWWEQSQSVRELGSPLDTFPSGKPHPLLAAECCHPPYPGTTVGWDKREFS